MRHPFRPAVDGLDDPRAAWLLGALRMLYDELDPDAVPVSLSVSALSSGQVVTYGFDVCGDEVTRLVTDLGGIGEAPGNGTPAEVIADATVRDGPP